jgi:predicted RND superfamily exporter protein
MAVTIASIVTIALRRIAFNGSPEMLARNDSALEFYNHIRNTFGDDRVIVIAIVTDDVFTPRFIEKLDRLTSQLDAFEGVAEARSITNLKAINASEGGVTISSLIPRRRSYDRDELSRLKEQITRDPLYAKHFISTDGTAAAINVFLQPMDEAKARATTEEIERIAKAEAGEDEVLLAGVPVVDARGIKSIVRDMAVLSPLSALLCMIVFIFAFRSFWGAVLPMAALLIGLLWTVALMSAAGRPFTLATLPLPTTLLAIGSSYIFHVLNQNRISMSELGEQSSTDKRRAAWLDGLKFISPAVIVSGTTTMAGFGSLASSSVPTARDMGIFEALGVLAMLVLTLTFIPAALTLLPSNVLGRKGVRSNDYARRLNGTLKTATALVLYRRRAVLASFAVATVAIGVGVAWLRVNTDYLRIFPPQSETVRNIERMREKLAGAATIQLVVSGQRGAVTDPDFLNSVGRLEQFAKEQHGVDSAVSAFDLVKRMHTRMTPGAADEIPKDRATLQAMFDEYLSSDETIARLVSADGSSAVVVLRTRLTSSNDLLGLSDRLDEWARANLPAGISARPTGSVILLNDASDAIAESQASSLAIALVSISVMMAVLFRSLMTAFLALIPNLLPIIGYFGFLGWAGITLDITTSLVASSVLGLAVDNAVHMIRRYRQSVTERGKDEDNGWAMWLTMLRTGKPMVLANLMLIAAFLIFMLSSFVPVRMAGLLWAVAVLSCLIADLLLLPALMKTKPFRRAALGGMTPMRSPEKEESAAEIMIK